MGAVFRLTGNTVMPAPGVRVLRAADYARLVEANDVLAAARERAAAMAAEAEKAYEERRQAGYEDGLMEGRMEQAEKMMETAMQAVEYIEGVEAKLVGVVTSAVRKIIGELDDRECTVRVVRNALNAVRSQQRVLIRVSPDDKDAVRTSLAAMISSAPNGATFLDVTADPRMKPGDCILECELGVLSSTPCWARSGSRRWPSNTSATCWKRPSATSIPWRRGDVWSRWWAPSSVPWFPV